MRDPRAPWYARAIAAAAFAYVLSPVQVIPDWVPVFGFFDGLARAGADLQTRASQVLAECRAQAGGATVQSSRLLGTLVSISVWAFTLCLLGIFVVRLSN
jgi:uncharacterized membrane protein YkvA (DUF1232 family)